MKKYVIGFLAILMYAGSYSILWVASGSDDGRMRLGLFAIAVAIGVTASFLVIWSDSLCR
jgi:hypothetical protein